MKRKREQNHQRAVLGNFLTGESTSKKQQCPLCRLWFSFDKIVTHASTCGVQDPFPISKQHIVLSQSAQLTPASQLSEPPSQPLSQAISQKDLNGHIASRVQPTASSNTTPASGCKNAFGALMAAQEMQHKRQAKAKALTVFRLDCIDGRLLPVWLNAEEAMTATGGTGAPSGCSDVWAEEVTFRDVPMEVSQNLHELRSPISASQHPPVETPSHYFERSVIRTLIVTNIAPAAGSPDEVGPTASRIAPSLLKSMLQKAVRRGKTDSAIRLATALADLSLIELLRRLPIIVMEDISLHPELPMLVWLMAAASKGYNPPMALLTAVLGIVLDVCLVSVRDLSEGLQESASRLLSSWRQDLEDSHQSVPTETAETNACASAVGQLKETPAGLSLAYLPISPQRTLIISLLFRASFGGLPGDVTMLEDLAKLWTLRFFARSPTKMHVRTSVDALLIPTLKYSVHHRYLTELANDLPWGKQVVLAFQAASQHNLRRQLCTDVCALLAQNWSDNPPVNMTTPSISTDYPTELNSVRILSRRFPLRFSDLVAEGIDPHCEPALLQYILREVGGAPAILHCLMPSAARGDQIMPSHIPLAEATENVEHVGQVLRDVIWWFRSSCNARAVWELPMDDRQYHEQQIAALLRKKKDLARVWALIARPLHHYCENRLFEIAARLKLS